MVIALLSEIKDKHLSVYVQSSGMRIYEQQDDLDQSDLARNKLQAVTKFSEQCHPKPQLCTVFSLYWSSPVSEHLKLYVVYLKIIFFFLTES